MKPTRLACALAATLVLGAGTALAAVKTINVATTGSDAPGCGAATAPCKTIQFAIDLSDDGDTVEVGAGTFKECIVVFPGTGVGGVHVLSKSLVDSQTAGGAILDGTGVCDAASATPGPVATVPDLGVLSGFAITNGAASGVQGFGAATITNNLIYGNTTDGSGGGIALTTGSFLTDPTLKAVVDFNNVHDNTAALDGGGIFVDASASGVASVVEIDGNHLTSNKAMTPGGAYGGGIMVQTDTATADDSSTVTITTNVLEGNTAGDLADVGSISYGAGIFVATGVSAGLGTETVTVGGSGVGNAIRKNLAHGIGGGISVNLQPGDGGIHTLTVSDNDVTKNTAEFGGGGIHAFALAQDAPTGTNLLSIIGNSVIGNIARGDVADPSTVGGGGIYAESYTYRTPDGVVTTSITRNFIQSNMAKLRGGGASLVVVANDDPLLDGNVQPAAGTMIFNNNLVTTNTADDITGSSTGGGVSLAASAIGAQATVSVRQRFLTVVGNHADAGGGGLDWAAFSDPDSLGGSGTIAYESSNSILKGNDGFAIDGSIVPGPNVAVTISYNDTIDNVAGDYAPQLGAATGTNGNVTIEPGLDALFVPPLCSVTIDLGDPAIDPSLEPLPNGGRVNLGHLGNTADAPRTFPDVNGDGAIDGLDVLAIAVSFNTAAGDPRFLPNADRDLDGLVDGQDLSYIAAFYAQSCPAVPARSRR